MVKIWLDENDGYIHYKIVNELMFDTLVSYFKGHYCSFDGNSKSYIMKPSLRAYNIYLDLKDYTKVSISAEDIDFLQYCIYPSSEELKRIKLNPVEELFEKHPPYQGLPPHENFQREAIIKTIRQNRIILDIEMRHGKTYIASMAIGNLLLAKQIDRVFIVCKIEGVENFRLELLRFLDGIITEDDIGVVTTDNRNIEDYFNYKIIITNYTTFRLSCSQANKTNNKSKAKKPSKTAIPFDKWGERRLIVLDECQALNNYDSIQSTFLHLYKDFFERRIEMSGSIGYKFLQMYSLCKFLVPEQIPYTFAEWRDYVSVDKGRSLISDRVKEFKETIIDKLMITYRNCMPQTEHEEVLTYCAMNEKMRKLYQMVCNEFVKKLLKEGNGNISGKVLLEQYGTLTQFTSDPSLLELYGWKFEDNPKIEVLKSLVEKYVDEENRKVIIWGSHPAILNKIAELFPKYKTLVVHGDESTSVKRSERMNTVNKFKAEPDSQILICNYVLATSISLVEFTAQIYWDLTSDIDSWVQSKKRFQGPLQKNKVFTHHLLFDKSIDNYVYYDVLLKKGKVKDAISNKENLSLDDYKAIFNSSRNFFLDGERAN